MAQSNEFDPLAARFEVDVVHVPSTSANMLGEAQLRQLQQTAREEHIVTLIVRADTPVLDASGVAVGRVLSGTLSPILNEAIGSALVTTAAVAQPLAVNIRGTKLNLQLVKPPFVELRKPSS